MIAVFDKNDNLKLVGNNISLEEVFVQEGEYAVELVAPIPTKPFEDKTEQFVFNRNLWSWVDNLPTDEKLEIKWRLVRSNRDQLLQASDWTQLPDVPIATKEAWAVYRQALRDITEQSDPFNITWPTPPQ